MVLTRLRLQRAALRLAAHGWPVTPGACLRADRTLTPAAPVRPAATFGFPALRQRTRRFDCGRLGCPTTACHPALDSWEQAASHDRTRVSDWWRYAPHSVLLATGATFDVLEVPAPLGRLVVTSPRWRDRLRGPVATIPTGRWMLLVTPGRVLLPELAGRLDVVRHGRGSWVPAPPTRLVEGFVRWTVTPAGVDWRLPDGYEVQRLLVDVLPPLMPRTRTPVSSELDRAA
jgi:Bifunctional DNA primase/polymerase, N-terminal